MSELKSTAPRALARRDEVVVQELPDEVLVYDLKNHKAHCLNQTAAFVWNHCDGKTSVAQLATLLEDEYQKPISEEVVLLALKQLNRANLLEKGTAPSEEGIRASRRAVLRKLGAAAAMTPLVISIIAPTASAGASVPPACTACIKAILSANDCVVPGADCTNVPGACFDNTGCGNGQFLECLPCGACPGVHGGTRTVSWEAATHGC